MRLSQIIVLAGLFALLAVACSPDDGATDGTEDAADATATATEGAAGGSTQVGLTDFAFEPADVSVPAGQVTVELSNTGEAPHTFTIANLGVDETVDPGATGGASFEAEPGSYELVCSFHEGQGMVATLTVTE